MGAIHMEREARKPSRVSRFRRLREAIAEHNWFSVAIEILIVTVGVLLAFQIDQWGDQRRQAREERQLLERLYRDYGRAADELKAVIQQNHDKKMRDIQLAFAARGDRIRLSRYSSIHNFGCAIGYVQTTPFSDTAFEELISSGRISVVSNPVLRGRIRDLTTEQASLRDRADHASDLALVAAPPLDPYHRYQLLPDGSTRCFTDWPEIFENPEAVNAMVRVYRIQEAVRDGRVKLMRMTQDVRREIACALGKPQCKR